MNTDPLRYFRVEARELVDQISAGVLDLDQRPGPELVARLLRFAHTLKGAARVVRQQDIADRAHAFEEVLVPHRADTGALPTDDIRELLRLNDEIEAGVAALEPGSAPAGAAPPEVAEPEAAKPEAAKPEAAKPEAPAPEGAASRGTPAPAPVPPPAGPSATADDTLRAARSPTSDVDELLDAIGEAHARFTPLRTGSRALDRLQRSADSLAETLRDGRAAPRAGDPFGDSRASALRLAGELRTLSRRLTDAVDQVERELDDVRGRAERLRLVATSTIFTALHRAVRDAADADDKRVVFAGHGGDLRMDPHVLAQAGNALLHVVRNAVVHGIEAPPDRAAAGKPVEGRIEVRVQRRGRYAALCCTDDGRGFDLVAVRRTAEARGLLGRGAEPSRQQLLDLVLRGGISTFSEVTEVAGRGIGLDVARDVAEQLGGTVTVRTETGVGTTVELVVPLSLLALHGLVVHAAGAVATVPLDAVRTCVRLPAELAAAAIATGRVAHDGQAVPFLPLGPLLAGAAPAGEPTSRAAAPDTAGGVAVVVAVDGDTVAVGVDRVAGTSNLVVRPLPQLALAAAIVGGVSMDLDGNPQLVLDAPGLVAEALRHAGTGAAPEPSSTVRLPILVVDDSLTTRMLERSILESAGYEVDVAASGEEGLAMARSRAYALFLTDIDMPGIDGFTFVERTRADPHLARVPAILVSSRADADDRRRGVEVGASAYVVKGEFDQEVLLDHIRELVPS